jgi:hypothetical protein
MKKIIIALSVFTIGLSAHAAGWAELLSSPYSENNTYAAPQTNTFSVVQPANPAYNNMFYQDPNQVQCQAPYVNPYLYRRPYGNINPYSYRVNPLLQNPYTTTTTSTSTSTGVPTQIVRNVGQSMLYSMMRGY